MIDDWCCYLIRSLDSNKTYIGSTNNFEKRLMTHNRGRGAKYTRGETWVPFIVITNMMKRECLSFEFQWKRLSKKRVNKRLVFMRAFGLTLKYTKNPIINRILDLVHFLYFHSFVCNKYTINFGCKMPIFFRKVIIKKYVSDLFLDDIPLPYFVIIE